MADSQQDPQTREPDERRCFSTSLPTTTSPADNTSARTTLNGLPDDILHEIAGHLCYPSPSDSVQRQKAEKSCCSFVASRRLFLGHPDKNGSGLLSFASISKRIRAVIFPVWLLRSVVFHLCREQWNRLQCLSLEMRGSVRSLTIETASERHTGNHGHFTHSDVIRRFPNLEDVSILMCPLRTTDSRYAGVELGTHDGKDNRIPATDSGIHGVISLSICVSNNQYISGNQDCMKMDQLQTLLRQLQSPRLQSLYLEFESPMSFVNWPAAVQTYAGVSFPVLQEVSIDCPILIGDTSEVDICAGVERILGVFESAPHIVIIDIQIAITIPADQSKSAFWQVPSSDNATSNELSLLSGVLPSMQQAMTLLAGQKDRHPFLQSFSVDVSLSVPNYDDAPTSFDFWHFCYPGTTAPSDTGGKSVEHDTIPDDGRLAVLRVSRDDVDKAEILHENYVDDLREAAYWEFGSGLLR